MAKKKIYPTLWWLFRDNLLPKTTAFVGYARSKLQVDDIRKKCEPYMKKKEGEDDKYEKFWKLNQYFAGSYDSDDDFKVLSKYLDELEGGQKANRLFYLALPPSVFEPVTSHIKHFCMGKR